ncbi:uncharacterized protein CMU_026360 [Cryptosporidium muris RN66]|uniref:Reactive oxygen species modulator 1 n=1 Tax=Cryptosporidium muris (strain RN66) TaxID=441375 RepID=B6AB77_CRYMR|nr:uncharacterized protein CMU_026360 [Cryptosporidium muris RN66]EEA05629.1 hypothetical protein, conserved [Cryptosporidium muris RN66]|eukprot:XP_002139978.1 hypothetical protein [Cryptosporidium muris RN66]
MTWPFSSAEKKNISSPIDEFVPPPPGGSPFAPPPEIPHSLKHIKDHSFFHKEFKGFSAPPGRSIDSETRTYEQRFPNSKKSIFDIEFSPRTRACLENIKMGMKMGASVGGIFGALTGVYAAAKHRNLLAIPLSIAGGAVSFGFFLGCGMIVRCESK